MLRSQAELIEKLFFTFFIISLFLFFYLHLLRIQKNVIERLENEKELVYYLLIKNSINVVNLSNVAITLTFPEKLMFYNGSLIGREIYNLNVRTITTVSDKITIKKEGNKVILI